MRVLSIGIDLDFATDFATFTEGYNVKDYDLVVIDLHGLDKESLKKDEYLSEMFEDETVSIPNSYEVLKAVQSGTDFLATMPLRVSAPNYKGRRTTSKLRYYDFIPGTVQVKQEDGESINGNSISEDWDWYFPAESFEWYQHFTGEHVALKSDISRKYTPIVKNGFGRGVSVKYDFSNGPGSIFLVPVLEGWNSKTLSQELVHRIIRGTTPEQESKLPEWTENYRVPGEEDLITEIEGVETKIEELENELGQKQDELAELERYKGLLYSGDDFLERLVPEVFEELGFEVDGEDPHHRDALIEFSDSYGVVEIHGTSGGIARKKCRQLDEWVGDLDMEHPDRNHLGVLIVNPMRNKPPSERNGYMTPDIESYLSSRGYKLLTTPDLFEMFVDYKEDGLGKDEIEELITGEDTVIEYP